MMERMVELLPDEDELEGDEELLGEAIIRFYHRLDIMHVNPKCHTHEQILGSLKNVSLGRAQQVRFLEGFYSEVIEAVITGRNNCVIKQALVCLDRKVQL